MVGKSAQMVEGENKVPPMYKLHKRLFPVLLRLACDVDQVGPSSWIRAQTPNYPNSFRQNQTLEDFYCSLIAEYFELFCKVL